MGKAKRAHDSMLGVERVGTALRAFAPYACCVVGETCRISATYRKHEGYAGSNPTYSIQMLESVDRVDDEP